MTLGAKVTDIPFFNIGTIVVLTAIYVKSLLRASPVLGLWDREVQPTRVLCDTGEVGWPFRV